MVPGGCLDETKTAWIASHPSFFLPVKRLSEQFKRTLLTLLRKAEKKSLMHLPQKYTEFSSFFDMLEKKAWVVHSQAAGKNWNPVSLIRYIARYAAKSAVSDKRVSRVGDNQIAISYYDRKKNRPRQEILSETECMRRLVFHVLPKGFKKVRCYGFLANRHCESHVALCRMLSGELLSSLQKHDESIITDTAFLFWRYFQIDITLCTECKTGHIEYLRIQAPGG